MKRINTWLITLMACSFSFFGCDSEGSGNHDVTVGWTMMGFQTCETMPLPQLDDETLIFETIHIEVFTQDNVDGNPIMFFDEPCENHFYTIQNLDEGEYVVTLDAMTEDGLAFFQMSIDIEAPAEEDEYVEDWEVGKGTVQVTWGFESGFCVGNGVETVDIVLENANGLGYEMNDVDCVDEIVTFEDVAWDSYSVSAVGYDDAGDQTHTGESDEDFEVLPGSNVNASVTLL